MSTSIAVNENDNVVISDVPLTWHSIVDVANGAFLSLEEKAWDRVRNARKIIEQIVHRKERAYGITTGLGALCDTLLTPSELTTLSTNALKSHACGVGAPLAPELVRAILVAQINNFAHGHSGVSPEVVSRLIEFLNSRITPVMPADGSVGYLTHMAHAALPVIGLGDVMFEGVRISGEELQARFGLDPVCLAAKDGLSLINGTPCSVGMMCVALERAERLLKWADIIAAMSFEALRGQLDAFSPEALAAKPFPGIQKVGQNLRRMLQDSVNLSNSKGVRTQDALSIRSIPQIHGASRDQFAHVEYQVNLELASATDNPLVFGHANDYRVISQANPHGQNMAMAADTLSVAVAELAGVAERRVDRLVNPLTSGLPPFLLKQSGVNSGLMIVQYVAASLVSENKVLAIPRVIDNYVTSGLQEDHLSMSTPAALRVGKILDNAETVLAIEYLVASQALSFFSPAEIGTGSRIALEILREDIRPYTEDRVVSIDIEKTLAIIRKPANLTQIETTLRQTL
ncbi:histidine ammonia-lyase [Paraburkholderia sp. J67]|uniref:HAL/PAL/TAL family ammonia-lyase n=1 Tax=Paraburkholderia sp. J67 TaxID=2805435 RepID=UPI002ABD8640|nr:histidine ammonia-lyase [Paraburkholderia sp. J67]